MRAFLPPISVAQGHPLLKGCSVPLKADLIRAFTGALGGAAHQLAKAEPQPEIGSEATCLGGVACHAHACPRLREGVGKRYRAARKVGQRRKNVGVTATLRLSGREAASYRTSPAGPCAKEPQDHGQRRSTFYETRPTGIHDMPSATLSDREANAWGPQALGNNSRIAHVMTFPSRRNANCLTRKPQIGSPHSDGSRQANPMKHRAQDTNSAGAKVHVSDPNYVGSHGLRTTYRRTGWINIRWRNHYKPIVQNLLHAATSTPRDGVTDSRGIGPAAYSINEVKTTRKGNPWQEHRSERNTASSDFQKSSMPPLPLRQRFSALQCQRCSGIHTLSARLLYRRCHTTWPSRSDSCCKTLTPYGTKSQRSWTLAFARAFIPKLRAQELELPKSWHL